MMNTVAAAAIAGRTPAPCARRADETLRRGRKQTTSPSAPKPTHASNAIEFVKSVGILDVLGAPKTGGGSSFIVLSAARGGDVSQLRAAHTAWRSHQDFIRSSSFGRESRPFFPTARHAPLSFLLAVLRRLDRLRTTFTETTECCCEVTPSRQSHRETEHGRLIFIVVTIGFSLAIAYTYGCEKPAETVLTDTCGSQPSPCWFSATYLRARRAGSSDHDQPGNRADRRLLRHSAAAREAARPAHGAAQGQRRSFTVWLARARRVSRLGVDPEERAWSGRPIRSRC